MATRRRAERGDDLKEFVGRVRKWKKEMKAAGTDPKSKKLLFQRWVATGTPVASRAPTTFHPPTPLSSS